MIDVMIDEMTGRKTNTEMITEIEIVTETEETEIATEMTEEETSTEMIEMTDTEIETEIVMIDEEMIRNTVTLTNHLLITRRNNREDSAMKTRYMSYLMFYNFNIQPQEMIKNLLKREEAKEKQKVEKKVAGEFDGYAECYPGLAEMDDALADSDDEADFSKMDMGNKKGPVGR